MQPTFLLQMTLTHTCKIFFTILEIKFQHILTSLFSCPKQLKKYFFIIGSNFYFYIWYFNLCSLCFVGFLIGSYQSLKPQCKENSLLDSTCKSRLIILISCSWCFVFNYLRVLSQFSVSWFISILVRYRTSDGNVWHIFSVILKISL